MSHCHIEGVLHAAKFPEHTSLLCVQGFASEQLLNMHNLVKVCLLYFSI